MNLRYTAFVFFMLLTATSFAQQVDSNAVKGSYLFYGQPQIEDNAMLLEEAFNQDAGKNQLIFNAFEYKKGASYSFTHEIPLGSHAHQLSYTIPVTKIVAIDNTNVVGIDDITVTYRHLLCDKYDWALVIPGITLIAPTGDIAKSIGNGGWGVLGAIAVTKRLSSRVTTHFNINGSAIPYARIDRLLNENDRLRIRHHYRSGMLGASVVWHWRSHFHFMVENQCFFSTRVSSVGVFEKKAHYTVNPGFRFALHHKKKQIVPAIGLPVTFADGMLDQVGVFIYLSVETSR